MDFENIFKDKEKTEEEQDAPIEIKEEDIMDPGV